MLRMRQNGIICNAQLKPEKAKERGRPEKKKRKETKNKDNEQKTITNKIDIQMPNISKSP